LHHAGKVFVLFLLLITFSSCAAGGGTVVGGKRPLEAPPLSVTSAEYLGTVATLTVYDDTNHQTLQGALAEIVSVDSAMSLTKADSEINRVNGGAGNGSVAVSREVYDLVLRAKTLYEDSDGAFNPAIGALSALWKEDGRFTRLPAPEEIEAALPFVHANDIAFEGGNRILLAKEGMQMDLGGIAKGYACDRAAAYLRKHGTTSALLDLGGNIYALGKKPDGSPWMVGIAIPCANESGYVCKLPISDLSVVTSGGYERFFEENGVTYQHILDSKTGYPADSDLLSATVVSASSTDADALATACFILGLEDGLSLLRSFDLQGILITKEKKIYTTADIHDKVEVTDLRFAMGN
jgi:thiamine biosynthesis lipoprotein